MIKGDLSLLSRSDVDTSLVTVQIAQRRRRPSLHPNRPSRSYESRSRVSNHRPKEKTRQRRSAEKVQMKERKIPGIVTRDVDVEPRVRG